MYFSMTSRATVFLGLLLLLVLLMTKASSLADDKKDAQTNAFPATLEEGLAHLEKVLGRYDTDDQLEWRVPTDFEFKSTPDPSELGTFQDFKGLRVIGRPFREW
jgi:hypothetical protein